VQQAPWTMTRQPAPLADGRQADSTPLKLRVWAPRPRARAGGFPSAPPPPLVHYKGQCETKGTHESTGPACHHHSFLTPPSPLKRTPLPSPPACGTSIYDILINKYLRSCLRSGLTIRHTHNKRERRRATLVLFKERVGGGSTLGLANFLVLFEESGVPKNFP